MRIKGSAETLEFRRRLAVEHLREGKSINAVARIVKASPSSVWRWKEAWEQKGLKGLAAKPHPGRRARLNRAQKKQLVKLLLRGPRSAGYATDMWTLARVAEVIEKRLGVKYIFIRPSQARLPPNNPPKNCFDPASHTLNSTCNPTYSIK